MCLSLVIIGVGFSLHYLIHAINHYMTTANDTQADRDICSYSDIAAQRTPIMRTRQRHLHGRFPGDDAMNDDSLTRWQSLPGGHDLEVLYSELSPAGRERPGLRRFNCELCGLSYSRRDNLARHMRVHQGKFFLCHHCDKKYVDRYDLKRHCEAQHAALVADCDECQKLSQKLCKRSQTP